MDDAVRARDAAREALADIEPDRLREVLDDRLVAAAVTPGVLALVTARALDPEIDLDGVADRAAGVQLIYEGLRLTRRLAHEPPWEAAMGGDSELGAVEVGDSDVGPTAGSDAGPTAGSDVGSTAGSDVGSTAGSDAGSTADSDIGTNGGSLTAGLEADIDADLDILAADVLVSRGFYLLARTEAAGAAVDVVRAFGRDQTLRGRESVEAGEAAALDRNLEEDVFELAVVAGTTAVGGEPPSELQAYARELAAAYDGEFPPPGQALPDATADRIAALSEEGA